MLVGIDTGYEGKFDFPRREGPPETAYLLASIPRTGSSYLSHVLWRTGCLGAPLEYLNFDPAGPYSFASRSAAGQQALWRSVVRRRTSPNGVFGVKCFPMQLRALGEDNPELLSEVMATLLARPPRRVVHLVRRDRVAHAVSWARASLSGVWRREQEQEGGARVPYSADALATVERWIDHQEGVWEAMFGDLRIEPLRLVYEDVVAEPERAVRQVAGYLGVALSPAAVVEIPPVERQAESDSRAWAERYAREKGA